MTEMCPVIHKLSTKSKLKVSLVLHQILRSKKTCPQVELRNKKDTRAHLLSTSKPCKGELTCCSYRKLNQESHVILKAKLLEEKYELKLNWNFLGVVGGGGVQNENPSMGGVWIFSVTTQ